MRFGYAMVDPLFFLKSIGNNWSVRAVSRNESIVEFRPEVEVSFAWSLILVPLFKLGGPWMARRVLEELKHYVENDEPHPRKQKALEKAAQKA
ncbi:MAG: hypothetical protein ACI9EW_000298 [Cellvibrionaceae bacterium]|jgi:hypothetical protein